VLDAASIDHHPQGQPPWGTGDRGFERAEDVGESGPLALGGHPSLEPDPLPEADLDRVLAAPALEQAQDLLLEKRRIHAEFEGHRPPEPLAEVGDERAQKARGAATVVHVAGTIAQVENLARLRQVREQRVVARLLALMGVEPPEGPGDLTAGRDHRAVDIDREPRQPQPAEVRAEQVVVERAQRLHAPLRELLEPIRHRARRREAPQPTEPPHQRAACEGAWCGA